MPYREVRVVDYQEVLRRWLAGDGIRSIARATGLDRKTVRKYVTIAVGMGLHRGDPWPAESVVETLIREAGHPRAPAKAGDTEEVLLQQQVQIQEWLDQDLLLTKVHELLARAGTIVPYSSLHRFAQRYCDFGNKTSLTIRKLEGKPGEFAEVDFGRLGYLQDLASSKPRLVYAFIMVLGYSRLSCVIPVFRYVPRLNRSFSEYAAFRGFLTDPARPYHPKDKPAVERHRARKRNHRRHPAPVPRNAAKTAIPSSRRSLFSSTP